MPSYASATRRCSRRFPPGAIAYDLGGAWTARTTLPFVFAVWATRPGLIDREVYEILHASRRAGSAVLPAIAADYTWNGRRYPEIALPYLRDAMRYRLGDTEFGAMRRFLAAAAHIDVIDAAPTITFAKWGHSAFSSNSSVDGELERERTK